MCCAGPQRTSLTSSRNRIHDSSDCTRACISGGTSRAHLAQQGLQGAGVHSGNGGRGNSCMLPIVRRLWYLRRNA